MIFPVFRRAFLLLAVLMLLENVDHCSADEEDAESGSGYSKIQQDYIDQKIAKFTLGLDASCDPSNLATMSAAENKAVDKATEDARNEYIEAIKKFLKTERSLCNYNSLLDCDSATKKCTCGPKHSHGKEYSYTIEKGQCLLAVGSPCYDSSGCATNSKCLIIKNQGKGPVCNEENRKKEADERKDQVDKDSIGCSCVGTTMGTGAVDDEKRSGSSEKRSSSSMNKPLLKLSLLTTLFFVFGASFNFLFV